MKYRWDKYEDDYDKLNGEGAYIEKYRLIPIYGDEYDDDVDSYTQCEDDINELYDEQLYNKHELVQLYFVLYQ